MSEKANKEIKPGCSARFTKTVSESDVYALAGVTGDFNPIHVNKIFANKSPFGKRIAHGMLSAGFISTVIGTKLPGPGTIYINQNIQFKKPVFIGDTITAIVEVVSIDSKKNRVSLKTYCTNQNDEVVLDGVALVIPPKER